MDDADSGSNLIFIVLGTLLLYTLLSRSERSVPNLKHISSIGYQGYLLSYIVVLKALFHGPVLLQQGYDQKKPGIFKLPTLRRWLVILTGTQYLEEIRKASEDDISQISFASEPDIMEYSMGHLEAFNIAQARDFTRYITQNLPSFIPDIRNELLSTIPDASKLLTSSSEWKKVDAANFVSQLAARTVDRIFVGNLARDKTYSDLSAHSLSHQSTCRSIVSSALPTSIKKKERQMRKILTAYVREEKQHILNKKHRAETCESNGLVTHVLQNDVVAERQDVDIALSILSTSSSVKQITAMCFAHALYHLASNPQNAGAMREEIKNVTKQRGWNKDALDRIYTLDSFVKESMRLNGVFILSTIRKSSRPFTFSDGTHIPQNTILAIPANSRHRDHAFYSDSSNSFNGFRFSSLRQKYHRDIFKELDNDVQFNLTTASTVYLPWGSGQHACPGRFFAAVLLKMLLAHILLHYDFDFEDGQKLLDTYIRMNCLPDLNAKILIRRR